MSLLKPFLFIASAGLLSACVAAPNGSNGFPEIGNGGSGGSVSVADADLASMLDSATMRDGILIYSYYTDVVDDGRVIAGADVYCGGEGKAVITRIEGSKTGRGYNTMLITCR